jgi:hypothetical protein
MEYNRKCEILGNILTTPNGMQQTENAFGSLHPGMQVAFPPPDACSLKGTINEVFLFLLALSLLII